MPELSNTEIIAFVCATIVSFAVVVEASRRARPGAFERVLPYVFLGQLLASLVFTFQCVVEKELLLALVNAAVSLLSLGGLEFALTQRRIAREREVAIVRRPSRPARGVSVLVRTGETLGTSEELARALDAFARAER